ncbi:GNAT family N-acetyltransferase [uncultured Clostridium sp.]|uniref:GNAT family N-acetyltransferase n=1 Tax=uncultured Clostridium sp. TaxID=59620 RepID=UPI0032163E5F
MNKLTLTEELIEQVKLPKGIYIREFTEMDFPSIQVLYEKEGWMTFLKRSEDALKAWENSNITLVALDGDIIVGLIRALTDGEITTYIAEILVDNSYKGMGIGKALIDICHNLYPHTRLDLLSTGADDFYQRNSFRTHMGFRKSYSLRRE